ncbi:MAG: penicillin-binding protein 1C [Bacteroidota bacterium]
MKNSSIHIKRFYGRILITLTASFILFLLLNLVFPVPTDIEYSTIITDNRGEVVHAFLTKDQQWRMKTELTEISPLLSKTIIAKEDKYFYRHPGINILAMGRAFIKNLLRGKRTSGASTITMQVARALEPRKRTYFNKAIEIFRALQLEWKYSKDEILQLYLNLVPYGGNIEGVKAASILYFKKNPDHLSLAEITTLSIIPNRPSTLIIGRNNDLIIKERNGWLQKFSREKVFTQKEIQDALDEPLTANREAVPAWIPHLAYRLKKHGTGVINTSIDMNTQSKIEKLVADYSRSLQLKNIRNAAVVVIDNRSHHVIAYLGSANFKDTVDAGQVDGVAAIRQPGSTLKPLLYGLCIDGGLLTPKTIISDVPVNYQGYAPENYDKKFNGYVSMEYALEHSLNIPAVKSLRLLGKDKLVQKLADCNFRQVKKDQGKLGLSLILGGCGATLEELTGLYSAFASDGVLVQPSYLQTTNVSKKSRILSAAANFMITETLSRVNRPDFPLNWQTTEHMPKIAWKTGTSYGRRDAWSIGYNKHYTIGIWTGNFSAQGIPELSGANIATPLLFKIFNTLDYDSDQEWFSQPADCALRQVCSETGLPPNDYCSNIVMDYFIPLVSPGGKCNNMHEIMVSADEKMSYCRACAPSTGYKKKWYKIIGADMQAWMDDNRIGYTKIPPHNPACEKIFREGAPSITSPANGTEYLISRNHPEPLQLVCRTAADASMVYWYVNDKFYKSAPIGAKQFFVPAEGPVKISCTDDKGRNRDVWIKVRYVDL